jgi:3-deoxy-D-manno-octulosonate 8-phosphate phosphatase (KDO 8-P phosphatase)
MALSADALKGRAQNLRLLLFDVDGVLTDGSVVISADGFEAKAFYIRDGAALVWAKRAGLEVGFLSGRSSEATRRRAAELGISILIQGETDKRIGYAKVVTEHGFADEEIGYMGDDLFDLPVIGRVGLSAAPADAVDEVRAQVDWISRHNGGRGAVREFVELVLKARGRWDALARRYSGRDTADD